MRAINIAWLCGTLLSCNGMNDGNDNNGYDDDQANGGGDRPGTDDDDVTEARCAVHVGEEADAQTRLDHDMIRLWSEQVLWTRLYIVSVAGDLDDRQQAFDRLILNQKDIGDAFGEYFGAEKGRHLTELLTEHVRLAGLLIAAAKTGQDEAVLDQINDRWVDNADEIAAFLHESNPDYWDQQELETMWHEHLKVTLHEATSRLKGSYDDDFEDFDAISKGAVEMADILTYGIVKQYPDEFQDCDQAGGGNDDASGGGERP